MLEDQRIVSEMQHALDSERFEVLLQTRIRSGKITGASRHDRKTPRIDDGNKNDRLLQR